MKRLVLNLSTLVALALVAETAEAQYPPGGYDGLNYAPNYGYQMNNYYYWGAPVRPYYPGGAVGQYYSGNDFHSEAVRRIMVAHSRYRYYTHPLSAYNSPPTQADYFGWDGETDTAR